MGRAFGLPGKLAYSGASRWYIMPQGRMSPLLGLGLLLPALACAILNFGNVELSMPYPANDGRHIVSVPPDVFPWQPRPMEGDFAVNTRLRQATRLFEGQITGVETIAIDANGTLALPDKLGNVRLAFEVPAGEGYVLQEAPIARLGNGRPLGAKFDAQGNLLMCDVAKGLIMLEAGTWRQVILATHISASSAIDPGAHIAYANSLDISANGTVYFTSSSDIMPKRISATEGYDTAWAWALTMLEGAPKGRLLAYHPSTGEVHVVSRDWYYPDGVALSLDETFIMMVETNRLRVVKLWLQGPKAGTHEVMIERLPGIPAGVTRSSDGNFWVSMTAEVPPAIRAFRTRIVRFLYAWMPARMRPRVNLWGGIFKMTPEGKVLQFLCDPTGARVASASATTEHPGTGRLFLGNLLAGSYISYIDPQQQH